jgi:hypothetical protein
MLHVCKIHDPTRHPGNILKGIENIMQKIPLEQKISFRLVGRMIPNVGFEERHIC